MPQLQEFLRSEADAIRAMRDSSPWLDRASQLLSAPGGAGLGGGRRQQGGGRQELRSFVIRSLIFMAPSSQAGVEAADRRRVPQSVAEA